MLGIDPPDWRRIQELDSDLGELHEVLRAAMNWPGGGPSHVFEFAGRRYGHQSKGGADADPEELYESAVLLSQLFPQPEDVSELRPGLFVYDSTACGRYELLFAGHRD